MSNDSVSRQWRPRSDSTDAQVIWAFTVRICPMHLFTWLRLYGKSPKISNTYSVKILTQNNKQLEMEFNPFMPSGIFYFKCLDRSVSYIRGGCLVIIIIIFVEILELNANRVDPNQMPQNAASDLGPHCLPMSLLWDAKLKWVKNCRILKICQKVSSNNVNPCIPYYIS